MARLAPRGARELALAGARPLLRALLRTAPGLRAVNALHRALPLAQKRRFFHLFHDERPRAEGTWIVDVAGRCLALPIDRAVALAWLAALAFHGYDTEVHVVYEALLGSSRPPRVFFDVGANIGLHSLKFLVHQVPTVSFEPNVACHVYFRKPCALNGVAGEVHALALAECSATAELAIPGGEAHRGTTVHGVTQAWPAGLEVTRVAVRQTSLDAFIAERGLVPDFVKIDTEGGELPILEGARALLESAPPLIVFESWPTSPDRPRIFALLAAAGYEIQPLTYPASGRGRLTPDQFLDSPATNFLADPPGRGLGQPERWPTSSVPRGMPH